jgi:peptidoglycan hydrolase-like protein with peptidoglycan-binding domain
MRMNKTIKILALASTVLIAACLFGTAANAAQAGMACVQKQMKELGFDAGPADGSLGAKTRAATEAYNDWMATRDASGVLPAISQANGQFWCTQVAKAHPELAKFQTEVAGTVLLLQFRGSSSNISIRFNTERANTSDCPTPCTTSPFKAVTLRPDSNGIATLSVEMPPTATRACIQMAGRQLITSAELFMNDGRKQTSVSGGDLEGNGRSACSFSGADAKKASTWMLTLS